jgi:hypothetical protein
VRRLAIVSAAIALSAILIAACSQQSGLALARQACDRVRASIISYDKAFRATSQSARTLDLRKANEKLQAAEPLAAAATSNDGQWNALMTTLNEMGQVDEGHLITALRAQCAAAESNQPELPTVPTTVPSAPSTS